MVEAVRNEKSGEPAVGTRVRVYPDSDKECRGVVVEDFGALNGQPVDYDGNHIADPARRWAVSLDDGGLVFVDTEQLAAE